MDTDVAVVHTNPEAVARKCLRATVYTNHFVPTYYHVVYIPRIRIERDSNNNTLVAYTYTTQCVVNSNQLDHPAAKPKTKIIT